MRKTSSSMDTKEIALTIYNDGFGAIKEIREIEFDGNETELIYSDVAQKIETESLIVQGLNILEFNYDFDLVSGEKLLEKYLDKEVFLKNQKTGEEKSCRLLSIEGVALGVLAPQGCVFEDNKSKQIYISPKETNIILPSLPSGLIIKPALVWKLNKADKTQAKEIKVSYLSKGFKWKANYVIELENETLDINGWAEIENECGTSFENVKIKLIAGDINRNSPDDFSLDERLELPNPNIVYSTTYVPSVEEKVFFDYHMYTLNYLTTLKNKQTKQINILNGSKIPYKQYYDINSREEKVNIIIEFENKKNNGLGIAIPKGIVKLYKTDEDDNSLEFIGEDSINHTPKNETIKLLIGQAFDIKVNHIQAGQKTIDDYVYYKEEYIIKNHKDTDAEIHLVEYTRGRNSLFELLRGIRSTSIEMVESSHEYEQLAYKINYNIIVPANDEVKIEFEYRIHDPIQR